jgi:hypothetical protein
MAAGTATLSSPGSAASPGRVAGDHDLQPRAAVAFPEPGPDRRDRSRSSRPPWREAAGCRDGRGRDSRNTCARAGRSRPDRGRAGAQSCWWARRRPRCRPVARAASTGSTAVTWLSLSGRDGTTPDVVTARNRAPTAAVGAGGRWCADSARVRDAGSAAAARPRPDDLGRLDVDLRCGPGRRRRGGTRSSRPRLADRESMVGEVACRGDVAARRSIGDPRDPHLGRRWWSDSASPVNGRT